MNRHGVTNHAAMTAVTVAAIAVFTQLPALAYAQGCEPIRFTTPVSLGGQGQAYQPAREWQLTLAYRRLLSKDWFVGTEERSELAPGGSSPIFEIHTVIGEVAYSLNDRYRLRLSVPVSTGSLERVWPDQQVHTQKSTGIGDISLLGEAWILNPRVHERGNFAIGIGLKAPTGNHKTGDQFYAPSGAVDYPADQTIQPGDGGWAGLLQVQGFREFTERSFGYAFGSYMVSPKARSDVRSAPNTGQFWSVPDVYSGRLGAAFSVLPDLGLTMSLGGRIDGIPVRDVLGGGDDDTVKRTSYVVFADPGISLTRGKGTLTASVPYRLKVNRMKSQFEERTNGLNAGGFARYLVFLSYSRRL